MVIFNTRLAEDIGLTALSADSETCLQILAGNQLPQEAMPIAQAYAGHQFGHFNRLGDGRAILLGEHITPTHQRVDIQLKGAGITPFSRNGDGRAALAPMLREYVMSEAMQALGIATTRSLAVVETGETVYRSHPLPGAVLTRIASSHLRVGTFEYALSRNDREALKALADYTIARHYADIAEQDNPYLSLLQAVAKRQATLIAQWMSVGFIHGVMNTDNMSICGETIDYGPCAMMNRYDPNTVYSSIDHQGRYAYGNQAQIASWNLLRFAECLLPLIDEHQEQAIAQVIEVMQGFAQDYEQTWLSLFAAKLGIAQASAADKPLIETFLRMMLETQSDFTNSFRALSEGNIQQQALALHDAFSQWRMDWQGRIRQQASSEEMILQQMRAINPAVIARNHLVEAALQAAHEDHDMRAFHALLAVLEKPFETPADQRYQTPPKDETGYQTFCGT